MQQRAQQQSDASLASASPSLSSSSLASSLSAASPSLASASAASSSTGTSFSLVVWCTQQRRQQCKESTMVSARTHAEARQHVHAAKPGLASRRRASTAAPRPALPHLQEDREVDELAVPRHQALQLGLVRVLLPGSSRRRPMRPQRMLQAPLLLAASARTSASSLRWILMSVPRPRSSFSPSSDTSNAPSAPDAQMYLAHEQRSHSGTAAQQQPQHAGPAAADLCCRPLMRRGQRRGRLRLTACCLARA